MPKYQVVMQRLITEVYEIEAKDSKEAAKQVLRDRPLPKKTSGLTGAGDIVAVLEMPSRHERR